MAKIELAAGVEEPSEETAEELQAELTAMVDSAEMNGFAESVTEFLMSQKSRDVLSVAGFLLNLTTELDDESFVTQAVKHTPRAVRWAFAGLSATPQLRKAIDRDKRTILQEALMGEATERDARSEDAAKVKLAVAGLNNTVLGLRPDWSAKGNCNGVDSELFFPERGESNREAKEVCRGCVVRDECLEYALTNGEKFGVWGGMSERERRRIRSQRRLSKSSATTKAESVSE